MPIIMSSFLFQALRHWSLNRFIRVSFQLHGEHTVLQPCRHIQFIEHISLSVLPGTHSHLSQAKHVRVPCPRTQTPNQCHNVERGETLFLSEKSGSSRV